MFSKNDKKATYSLIPDVDEELGLIIQLDTTTEEESLLVSETSLTDPLVLAEKYPDANEHERAFLGALDNAISKCSNPSISLPIFHAKDLGPPDSPQVFLESLCYPTLALLASLTMGVSVIVANSPTLMAFFPYISCMVLFLASVPPFRKRFLAQASIILTRTKSQKESIESKVMLLCNNAISQVDTAETYMDAALKPIKSKLDKITELEQTLRIIDPTIDIPDVSDIEEAFDGCTDKIRYVIGELLKAVDFSVSKAVPRTFQSEEILEKRIFYPLLAILLFIQIVGIWVSTHQQGENDIVVDSNDPISSSVLETHIGETETSPTQMDLMIVSIQTYLTSMVELILVYVASNISLIARKINTFIKSIEEDFNGTLKNYTSETFTLVFGDKGLGGVRTKTLKLINDVEKIEGPLKKAIEMVEYKAKMEALKEKALAEAEEKAREAAEKVREAAEKAKKEAVEKMEALKEKARKEAEEKAREAEEKAREAAEKAKKEAAERMEALKEKARKEAEEKAREAEEKAREAAEKAKKEAAERMEALKEKARKEAEEKAREAEEKAREAAERMEALKEKARKEAEEKARETAEKMEALKEKVQKDAEEKAREAAEKIKIEAQQKKEEAEKRAAQAQAVMGNIRKLW